MSINIVNWKPEGVKAQVTIEADTFTEVTSLEAKNKAIEEGNDHFGLCGISGSSGPYPVDPNTNQEVLDATKLAELSKDKSVQIKYRNDFYINRSFA